MREKLLSKTRLSEVKQACPGIEYNQIRFVLACLIRDFELTCEMQLLVECRGGGGGGEVTDLLTYNGGSCPFGLKKGFCARSSDFYM